MKSILFFSVFMFFLKISDGIYKTFSYNTIILTFWHNSIQNASRICYTIGYNLVCYYTNWAQYRSSEAKFLPENIDPFLCTHIIYAFAKLDTNSQLAPFEWNDQSTLQTKGMYQRVTDLKKTNPNLKILLSVGGKLF
jgi:GH18 family chitinase